MPFFCKMREKDNFCEAINVFRPFFALNVGGRVQVKILDLGQFKPGSSNQCKTTNKWTGGRYP